MSFEPSVLVTNIQRFSLQDGPGIRTTVFLKGCNLHCPWCANPENIAGTIESYLDTDGELQNYGYEISLKELYYKLLKDKNFYSDNGGVTFSGGEPLLQLNKMEPLLKKLHDDGITICIETAMFVDISKIRTALDYIDFFYVDIKILDKKQCSEILGGMIQRYVSNIRELQQKSKKVVYRIPLINGMTDTDENIKNIVLFCRENNINEVELVKGHNLAKQKYQRLKKNMYNIQNISDDELIKIKNYLFQSGINAVLYKI